MRDIGHFTNLNSLIIRSLNLFSHILRMKEYEREWRLKKREHRIKQKQAAAEAAEEMAE